MIIALTYYTLTIRNQNKMRQAQLLMQIVNQWSQPGMVEARDMYDKMELNSLGEWKDLWADHERSKIIRRYMGWVEGIGVLVRENYLDVKAVAGLMSGNIKHDWEKMAPSVLEWREEDNRPRLMIEWEHLYNAIMKYLEEHPEFQT